MHIVEKNGVDILNNLILQDLSYKVELLEFSIPINCYKDYFTCNMVTNTVIYLLFLSILKGVLKFFQIFTIMLEIDKNLYCSMDNHLLLLVKSKIDYLML